MTDLISVLVILFIVTTIITVVGHGIWVIVAIVLREVFGTSAGSGDRPPHGLAGVPVTAPEDTPLRDLTITQRQLEALFQREAITQEQLTSLTTALRAERERTSQVKVPPRSDVAGQKAAEGIVFVSKADGPQMAPAATTSAKTEEIVTAEIVPAQPAAPKPTQAAKPPQSTKPKSAPSARRQETPRPAPSPRRTLADLLQAFMEEKNIRWGELLSGLLIVGSAVGLVISLRHTLSQAIPYFPALLFMLGTAAIHGAGNYTLRRWNLRATSRGMLLIATLLIPLNFLAAIAISGPEDHRLATGDPRYLAAVAIGLLSFGAMAYFASRALMRDGWWRLFVVVMGTCAAQLLINRIATPEMPLGVLLALAALPLACFFVTGSSQVIDAHKWQRMSARRAEQLLLFLGVALFSVAAPIGLLLTKAESVWAALAQLTPLLSCAAAVILAVGLLIHQRTTSFQLAKTRVTGTALTLSGAFAMLLTITLAWPDPQLLIAVGLVNCALFIACAVACRFPALHGPAVACFGLASVVGFHLVGGAFNVTPDELQQTLRSLLVSDGTSLVLTLLALLAGGCGVWLWQITRKDEARQYLWSCVVLSGLSVAIALLVGLKSWPDTSAPLATFVLVINAVALLVVGPRLGRGEVTFVGSSLLLAGFVYGLTLNHSLIQAFQQFSVWLERPVLLATLVHATVAGGLALVGWLAARRRGDEGESRAFVLPLSVSALISSVLALPFVLLVKDELYLHHGFYAAWVGAIWLAIAISQRSRAMFAAFQTVLTCSLVFFVCAIAQARGWDGALLELEFLLAQMGALAVWCGLWSGGRMLLANRTKLGTLIPSMQPTVDQVVLGILVAGIFVVALVGCAPGLAQELGAAGSVDSVRAAFGTGAWIVTGLVLSALVVSWREHKSPLAVIAILLAMSAATMLIAAQFHSATSVASAMRWLLAIHGAIVAVVISAHGKWRSQRGEVAVVRGISLILSGVPILGLTCAAALEIASGGALGGPGEGTLFDIAGPMISYAVPLLVYVGVLLAYAVGTRSPACALSGSAVFQVAISLGFLLGLFQAGRSLDAARMVELLQWNALGLAVYSLVWLSLKKWIEPNAATERPSNLRLESPLQFQLAAALFSVATLACWAIIGVIVSPHELPAAVQQLGRLPSYLAVIATVVACSWYSRERRVDVHLVAGVTLLMSGIVSVTVSQSFYATGWVTLRLLLMIWLVAATAGVVALASVKLSKSGDNKTLAKALSGWSTVLTGLAVFLTLRSCPFDPEIIWHVIALAAAGLLAGTLAVLTRRQIFAYASTALAMLAALLCWRDVQVDYQTLLHIFQSLSIVAVTAAGVWLAVEVWWQRRFAQSMDVSMPLPPVHHAVAVGATLLLAAWHAGMLCLSTAAQTAGLSLGVDVTGPLAAVVLGLLGCLLVASLWDQRGKHVVVSLYVFGASVLAVLLHQAQVWSLIGAKETFVLASVAAAFYVAATGHAWRWSLNLARWGTRLGMRQLTSRIQRTGRWLPGVNLGVVGVVSVIALVVVLSFEGRWLRYCAVATPMLLAYGVLCLAQDRRREAMKYLSLLLAGVAFIFAGWADIAPSWTAAVVLERAARLLIGLAVLSVVFVFAASRAVRADNEWFPALRRASATSAGSAITALLLVLVLEAAHFVPGVGAPIAYLYQTVAVAIVLGGLIVALLVMAVLPDKDLFSLSEKGRKIYVYAAEAVGVLLAAHLYLCEPALFNLPIQPYWPLIVMAIAFFGVGASELFDRRDLRVLSEPMRRTAAFLPLLPLLAFWVIAEESVLSFAKSGIAYSTMLLIVGLLYATLSLLRRSFASGVAAALAGNAALWAFFTESDFLIVNHPQFWLIPPALSVLIAAHINRDRLPQSTLAAIRYGAVLLIYVSSTAEMMIQSASQNLWPPMVLAVVAVIGALAGIVMRIRAFLYLGSTFLFFAVVSMVWHAARAIEHVWPWWAFGMGFGLFILALFGLFELKRKEITQMIEHLRRWDK